MLHRTFKFELWTLINEMVKELGVIASGSRGNHEFEWGVISIAKWAEEGTRMDSF